MEKVGNDIKVLLTKFNKRVKVDDIGGELILYDNTKELSSPDSTEEFMLKEYVFSGVIVSGFAESVKLKLEDFYGKEIQYALYKNYIYVKKTATLDITDPIAVIRFLPVKSFWAGSYFYAHFLELKD